LPLPPALRWIEVDLPEILDAKEVELAGERPVCVLERVRLDLADRAARQGLLERVNGAGGPVLVVTEGLLVYLGEDNVRQLAADLAAQPAMRWWLIDLVPPFILRFLQRTWGKSLDAAAAPMRFAPAEGLEFFRPLGWSGVEFHPFVLAARRLHREMSYSWLRRLLSWLTPRLRREMLRAGVALLARQ
jgi:O-methyltransferase involved in polyketide biosynthesis